MQYIRGFSGIYVLHKLMFYILTYFRAAQLP